MQRVKLVQTGVSQHVFHSLFPFRGCVRLLPSCLSIYLSIYLSVCPLFSACPLERCRGAENSTQYCP